MKRTSALLTAAAAAVAGMMIGGSVAKADVTFGFDRAVYNTTTDVITFRVATLTGADATVAGGEGTYPGIIALGGKWDIVGGGLTTYFSGTSFAANGGSNWDGPPAAPKCYVNFDVSLGGAGATMVGSTNPKRMVAFDGNWGTLNANGYNNILTTADKDQDPSDLFDPSVLAQVYVTTGANVQFIGKYGTYATDPNNLIPVTIKTAPARFISASHNPQNDKGTINVNGHAGHYNSEVLSLGGIAAGDVAIKSIDAGDDVWVMLWLSEEQAGQIAALETELGLIPADQTPAGLQAQYAHLAGRVYDAVAKFSNKAVDTSGFSFDFGGSGVTVDKVAAVPEPASLGVLALGALGLMARRRR